MKRFAYGENASFISESLRLPGATPVLEGSDNMLMLRRNLLFSFLLPESVFESAPAKEVSYSDMSLPLKEDNNEK